MAKLVNNTRLIARNREFAKKHNLPTLAETFELNKDLWHLSGFKPLSERFDPDWFRPAALDFIRNKGKYINAPFKSRAYREYWDLQIERCRNGFKTHGYTCPGDLYYFLNFYVLPVLEQDNTTGRFDRPHKHPKFWDVHYYFSHYVDIAIALSKDGNCLKPRGVGWSEYNAAMGCNRYTTIPNSVSMFGASSIGYLTSDGIMSKVNRQLSWQNENTQRAFKHLRGKKNTPLHSVASRVDRDGTERGFLSQLIGKVVDSTHKLRGTRTNYLGLEEAGSFKNLLKAIDTAKALTEIGGQKFGFLMAFGTGGDESSKGEALEGLKTIFYNPAVYNMLGLKNRYNEERIERVTGFFFASYECMMKYMNNQGITDLEAAYTEKMELRKLLDKTGNVSKMINEKAEYPFWPEEAFMKGGTNMFDRIRISNQKMEKMYNPGSGLQPERGELEWTRDTKNNKITGVKWIPRKDGRIVIFEHPNRDQNNKVFKNLYIGGIDSIDQGSENSLVGEKGSKFGLLIKKRYLNAKTTSNIYVARYLDRPTDERIAYEISLKLAIYYNCKYNVERTKKEILSYYRQHKMLRNHIVAQPSILSNDLSSNRTSNVPGTPITEKVISHYIALIKQYIVDYAHLIDDVELLDQLLNYSDEMKTAYDLIAAMGMCELLDEDMDAMGRVPQAQQSTGDKLKLFGYYYDQHGYKRHGEIPENSMNHAYTRLGFEVPKVGFTKESTQDSELSWVDGRDSEEEIAERTGMQFELDY